MKKLIFLVTGLYCCGQLKSQSVTAGITTDSNRVVLLQEVTVGSLQKNNQQDLVNFYRSNNAATLEDIMSRLPELSLVRRGVYGMEASVRSFTGGQINVLVDGMRIHGACTDKMDPATIYIEPINLENLQVQTAANGFLNGSSVGGTINMKMAEPAFLHNNTITGMVSSGYQTAAKSFYESLRLNYASGRWAFRASGTYRNNKNYRGGGGQTVDFSQFEKVNYSFSAKYQQTQYTYLKADVLADDGWNIGYAALPMDVGYAAARIVAISINNENRNRVVGKWQAKIYGNTVRHFMDDTKRPFVPMHMDMPGESRTIGFYAEGEIKKGSRQKLVLHADGASTFLKASMTMYQAGQIPMYMLTWPDNKKDQYGLGATWLMQFDSTLKLQAAARVDVMNSRLVTQEAKDQLSVFGYLETRRNDLLKDLSVQLSKRLHKKIKLSAGFSFAERMPTASELYGFYLFNSNDGYDYIGNPGLKTERSLQGEFSFSFNGSATKIQVTGYFTKLSNYISNTLQPALSTMTIGAKGVRSFVNTGSASIAGAEAIAVLQLPAAMQLVSTLRYTYGKTAAGDPLPYIAPLKNISSLRYQHRRGSFQLETEYALQQNRFNAGAGEDYTGDYFLLHARIGYELPIFKKVIELQTGIENIFDTNYHDHLDWRNIARPGRNIYIQLKAAF